MAMPRAQGEMLLNYVAEAGRMAEKEPGHLRGRYCYEQQSQAKVFSKQSASSAGTKLAGTQAVRICSTALECTCTQISCSYMLSHVILAFLQARQHTLCVLTRDSPRRYCPGDSPIHQGEVPSMQARNMFP